MPTALNLPPEECLSRETLEPSKGRFNSWDDTRYFLQLSTFLAQLPELFLQVKTWEWLNSGLLGIYTNIHITDCENCLCIVQFVEDDGIPYAPSFL